MPTLEELAAQRPATANPTLLQQIAKYRGIPRPDVTDFAGYGPSWGSYLENLSRNFAGQFEGLGTPQNFMGPFGFGGITAFHGSPHNFSKFDMSKVGTGEGAQAYGRGLYFAENPKVANQYAKELGGSTYKVDIPDESVGKMLDWGKPLGEQPESVKKALAPVYREYLQKNGTPQRVLDYHVNKATGEDIYHALRTGRGNAAASAMLKEMGIPGIRYLDQGSRVGGAGTSNFVVFDDQLPKIIGKE